MGIEQLKATWELVKDRPPRTIFAAGVVVGLIAILIMLNIPPVQRTVAWVYDIDCLKFDACSSAKLRERLESLPAATAAARQSNIELEDLRRNLQNAGAQIADLSEKLERAQKENAQLRSRPNLPPPNLETRTRIDISPTLSIAPLKGRVSGSERNRTLEFVLQFEVFNKTSDIILATLLSDNRTMQSSSNTGLALRNPIVAGVSSCSAGEQYCKKNGQKSPLKPGSNEITLVFKESARAEVWSIHANAKSASLHSILFITSSNDEVALAIKISDIPFADP